MTRFTLIALKMALPSATKKRRYRFFFFRWLFVKMSVIHALIIFHTHPAETHTSRTASDHSIASVGWYREVTLFRPVVWHPCQVEAK